MTKFCDCSTCREPASFEGYLGNLECYKCSYCGNWSTRSEPNAEVEDFDKVHHEESRRYA